MKHLFYAVFLFTSILYSSDNALDNSIITGRAFKDFTFSWTAVHGNPERNHFEVDVLHAPDKTLLDMYIVIEGKRNLLSKTAIIDGFWYVTEKEKSIKYRPYEAHYNLPTTYYYLMKSKVQFVSSQNIKLLGKLSGSKDGCLQFYRPMSTSEKENIRKRVDLLKNKLIPESQSRAEENFYLLEAKKLLEYAKNGKLNEVEIDSGVICTLDMSDGVVRIKDFQWITIADQELFKVPGKYTDLSAPVKLEDQYLFGYNHNWEPGMLNIQTDGRMLDRNDDSMRRLPFKGAVCTPFDTDPEKGLVYVTGILINSNNVVPFVIDLKTGRNSPIGPTVLRRGLCSSLTLSPNKQILALLHNPKPAVSEARHLILVNLHEKSMQRLKLDHPAQKVVWHSDGKSLFVTVFDEANNRSIITRVTPGRPSDDILEGASPTVLPDEKRLLFLDLKDQLWKSCDFDGNNILVFHNGLPHLQHPCLDAKSGKIVMILRDDDGLSIPVTYDPEKQTFRNLTKRTGLWLSPVAVRKK